MNKTQTVIIIGAGLMGLSIADNLLAEGFAVTLLETKPGPGQGAGQYNSGMVHPSQVLPWDIDGVLDDRPADDKAAMRLKVGQELLPLAQQSADRIEQTMQRLGLKVMPQRCGTVQLFDDHDHWQAARTAYAHLGVRCEDASGNFISAERYGLFFKDDFLGDPWIYAQALAADIRARGAQIIYNCPLPLNPVRQNGFWQVAIKAQAFRAEHCIVAAGTGTSDILERLGVERPLMGVTGHALNFSKPDMVLPIMPIMHAPTRSALSVFDDHIRLSGTTGIDDPQAGAQALYTIWQAIAPDILERAGEPLLSWSAQRPVSRTGQPFMGPVEPDGLWVCAGHGHMGWTLCAGAAAYLTQQIVSAS